MNVTLLTGAAQITSESSIFDRLKLGGSTLLLGMAMVFMVLGIIFIALQIMRAAFTKNTAKAKKAEKVVQNVATKSEALSPMAKVSTVTTSPTLSAAQSSRRNSLRCFLAATFAFAK